MSTVSFPGSSTHSPSSSTTQEGFFGSSYNPSSSFQVNPLSPQPPRTPRTSMMSASQSYVYGSEVYESTVSLSQQEETREKPLVVDYEDEEVAEDVEGNVGGVSVRNVKTPEIWRELLKTTSGRDKAFYLQKVLQYTLRVYLLFHTTIGATRLFSKRTKTSWEIELVKRLETTASSLSTTRQEIKSIHLSCVLTRVHRCRKALIMFNWLTPLSSILATRSDELDFSEKPSKEKDPSKPLLHTFLHAPPPALLDLVNGLSDDIYAFYRLGLIGKKTALVELSFERNITKSKIQAAESHLYVDSMSGTTASSKSTTSKVVERELEKLHRQDFWLRIQRTKLLLDLLFVSYELFKIKPLQGVIKPFAGLGAAMLSTARLFHNHRTALILKQTQ
ncbi:hypothetical protein EW145_g5029 [Phellinidium pouzarii]|uniref:Uncharacterized protein n=1 Tax=Phellinidium pouzarii TaxID=167371 RepID=A0A4S4L1Q1_9AGAM|nr:hypothetical protein EW145_g5029 [Phellinidium pouzarii]